MSKQREIRFRAWDKVHSEMVKVKTIDFDEDGRIEEVNTETYCHFPLDKDTVVLMQFTGLHDKGGKEIYEGDVVTFIVPEGAGQIELPGFRKGVVSIHTDGVAFGVFKNEYCKGASIVGNVHENPELLSA